MSLLPSDTAEKLRRVQSVTDAALSRLDVDDLLTELLERTRDLLAVDTAAIVLVDPSGTELVATAASGLEEVRPGLRAPLGTGFAGRVAALARPIALEQVDADMASQVLIDRGLVSMLGVPMFGGDQVIGVLHIGTTTPRVFGDDDVELLQLVADRASLATQARLSQLDRAATLALQRSLLPTRPPAVPGVDVAARYIPGAEVGVGGDWYDLFTLPSGHTGVVIGDVAGSGLRAAVVMGRIRSALRAYALETDNPADVLTRLDRKIQVFELNAMATATYAVIAPDRRTVTLSQAGHLPGILIDTDGAATLVEAPTDLPLGAYPDAPRRNTTVPLGVGSRLFLYTDGLVERRGQPVTDGIERLVHVLGQHSVEELCDHATDDLLEGLPTADDVAILALRRDS